MKFYLYTDGSYKQDANVAGIGGFLKNQKNEEIFAFSKILEDQSLYYKHETLALEYGLIKCVELGIKDLHCFGDSEDLFNICNIKDPDVLNKYIVKNPNLSRIINLLPNFNNIIFKYIPREENKKADYLANKSIKHLLLNKKFEPKNIICIEHFDENGKFVFNAIKNKVENYLVFEIEKIKKEYVIKSTKTIKNNITKEIKILFNEERIVSNKDWVSGAISHISETIIQTKLKYNSIDNLGIMFYGSYSKSIDKILRGQVRLSKEIKTELNNLDIVAKNFKKLIIHESRDIIDFIKKNEVKEYIEDENNKENPKEFILKSLRILGDNYQLGTNKQIENYFDLPDNKKRNVEDIQKKYFGELVKIVLFEMRNQGNKRNVKSKMNLGSLRQDLEKEGIKFTY